jgi:hypothetical protein
MKKIAAIILVLFVTLFTVPAHALGEAGPLRRAVGNYLARSAKRSLDGAARLGERGDRMRSSSHLVVRKLATVYDGLGALRFVSAMTKVGMADRIFEDHEHVAFLPQR